MHNGGLADLTIDRAGTWREGATIITHPAVLKCLRASLRHDGKGGYLVTAAGQDRPVFVEDTPRFVTSMSEGDDEKYALSLDGGDKCSLEPTCLRQDPRGLITQVGAERLPARFLRTAFIDAAHFAEETEDGRIVLPLGGGRELELHDPD